MKRLQITNNDGAGEGRGAYREICCLRSIWPGYGCSPNKWWIKRWNLLSMARLADTSFKEAFDKAGVGQVVGFVERKGNLFELTELVVIEWNCVVGSQLWHRHLKYQASTYNRRCTQTESCIMCPDWQQYCGEVKLVWWTSNIRSFFDKRLRTAWSLHWVGPCPPLQKDENKHVGQINIIVPLSSMNIIEWCNGLQKDPE